MTQNIEDVEVKKKRKIRNDDVQGLLVVCLRICESCGFVVVHQKLEIGMLEFWTLNITCKKL